MLRWFEVGTLSVINQAIGHISIVINGDRSLDYRHFSTLSQEVLRQCWFNVGPL